MGCSPWGCEESDTTEELNSNNKGVTRTPTNTHTHKCTGTQGQFHMNLLLCWVTICSLDKIINIFLLFKCKWLDSYFFVFGKSHIDYREKKKKT